MRFATSSYNIVADALTKQGYDLYFYKKEKSTVEMDFFIRDTESLIPIEVKAKDKPTPSLNKLIESKNVNYGIKLCYKNFGFNGKFYTIPYFAVFCLKRWIKEKAKINPHHPIRTMRIHTLIMS